jgi:hypothetical protein
MTTNLANSTRTSLPSTRWERGLLVILAAVAFLGAPTQAAAQEGTVWYQAVPEGPSASVYGDAHARVTETWPSPSQPRRHGFSIEVGPGAGQRISATVSLPEEAPGAGFSIRQASGGRGCQLLNPREARCQLTPGQATKIEVDTTAPARGQEFVFALSIGIERGCIYRSADGSGQYNSTCTYTETSYGHVIESSSSFQNGLIAQQPRIEGRRQLVVCRRQGTRKIRVRGGYRLVPRCRAQQGERVRVSGAVAGPARLVIQYRKLVRGKPRGKLHRQQLGRRRVDDSFSRRLPVRVRGRLLRPGRYRVTLRIIGSGRATTARLGNIRVRWVR